MGGPAKTGNGGVGGAIYGAPAAFLPLVEAIALLLILAALRLLTTTY